VRVLTTFDRAQIEELLRRDEFFWLDLEAPSHDVLEQMRELFDFHPLTLKAHKGFPQQPKLHNFGPYAFVIFYGAHYEDAQLTLVEVHLLISGSYVVTVHQAPSREIDELRDEFSEGDTEKGEQFVVFRIFEALTDSFIEVLSQEDAEMDGIEDEVIRAPTDDQLKRIFSLKQDLVTMRRVVMPQRDLFARAIDEISDLPGLEASSHDYFRTVYDHLIRISDEIDSYRDLLTSAMDVYLSTVSNRLNQVTKQLALVATIFLPLTLVTGFFGQNFAWLVAHIDTFGDFMVFGVGGLLIPLVLLVTWFRRAHYL
jgi:magnesium transporter